MPEGYSTLPELFQRQGFTTIAVVSNAVLSAELGWNRGFDEYLETWSAAGVKESDPVAFRRWLNAPRVNEIAKPLLERHRDAEHLFVWLHYSDPHSPYVLPEGEHNPFLGDALYVGDQVLSNDEANAQSELPDYTVVDARLYVPLGSRGVVLFAGVRNLFDQTYATRGIYAFDFVSGADAIFVTPAPGRYYTAGLRWDF